MSEPVSSSSREKILDVSEARFARRGYAGVGLRELAEAAGLSKSSLFHHFPSKAALYCAVLERVLRRVEQHVDPAARGVGTVPERVEAVLDALIGALAEHSTSSRLLLRALFEDDDLPDDGLPEADTMNATLSRVLGALQALLAEGVADGSLRPASVPHTLQTLIGATIYHFASGEFGEELLGEPLYAAHAVQQRRREVKDFVRYGLMQSVNAQEETGP